MDSNFYLFYKKYHKNRINKLIHLFCIPMIVWSFCVILNKFTSCNETYFDGSLLFKTKIDLSLFTCFSYLLFYFLLDYYTLIPMFLYLSFIYGTSYLFNMYVANSVTYAIYINIFSWIMQFIGHYFFEGNRPALIDSIFQSFLMAPLFSYFEFKEMIINKKD